MGRRPGVTNVLLEVSTDEGITGLGEAVGFPSVEIVESIIRTCRPRLLGQDPFNVERIMDLLYRAGGWQNFLNTGNIALGGIEMALWDIIGKACDKPLYQLFGGLFREKIPYMYFLPRKGPEEMAEQAAEAVEEGFRTLYIKVGVDPEEDVQAVQAIRGAVGSGPKLRVDANEAWSPSMAISMIRKMEPYDLEFVEQPVHFRDFDGLAAVKRAVGIPIAANQTSWTQYDVLEIIKRQAADIILTDPHQLGGLYIFKKVAAMAEYAGMPIVKHSFCDLGVSANAAMHIMASTPNFTLANQAYVAFLSDDIIVGGLPHYDGDCLTVSRKPGIGVELDPDKVERYARLYREVGEFSPFTPGTP